MTQAPTPGPLWMMHVIGPDDIYPAPDHATAVEWCAALNASMPASDVLCVAVPAIWTGTPEAHAEGLSETVEGWTSPRQRLAPTAPVEASGSEGARIATVLRERVQIGGTDWEKSSYGADMNAEEVADAILNLRPQPSGETRDDPDFWCRLMGEALDALDIIAYDEPWLDGANSAVFAEKASATIRAKYADLSSEPHDERRGGYDRSDVRYGLQLIADEECDEVAASYYAKKAIALLSARPLALGGQQGPEKHAGTIEVLQGFLQSGGETFHSKEQEWALKSAIAALSTTPARAEAQDEGAAGWFRKSKANPLNDDWYPVREEEVSDLQRLGYEVRKLYAHPSPTPAADADRVREALKLSVDALFDLKAAFVKPGTYDGAKGKAIKQAHVAHRSALAALKSTAAKEGGEA